MVMNDLYGLQDIGDDVFHSYMRHDDGGAFRNTVQSSMMVSQDAIMSAIKAIYNKTIQPGELSPELFEAVSNVIQSACQKGIGQSAFDPDEEFKRQLLHSADVFAAFKVHSAQQAIASKLLDDQGNLRSFRDFKQAVLPITSHQCGRWLRTEYDTAVIRAHQAADWQQFLEEADVLPNLEWMPSTSANPGADHQVFWGTILPISDPFWNEHRPGDRWNCKCSLQATDKRPTGRPTSASPVNTDPQPGLESNPGTATEVFSQSHPYFPTDCNSCSFRSATVPSASADGNFKNQTKDCYNCRFVSKCINEVNGSVVKEQFYTRKETAESEMQTFDGSVPFSNLQTGSVLLSNKTKERLLSHCRTSEEIDIAIYIWKHIARLQPLPENNYEVLGEGKDLSDPKDAKNVEKKRRRGVVGYYKYYFEYGGNMRYVKFEKHRRGFEQPYSIYIEKA